MVGPDQMSSIDESSAMVKMNTADFMNQAEVEKTETKEE